MVNQFSDGINTGQQSRDLQRLRAKDLITGDVLICSPAGGNVDGIDLAPDKLGGSLRLLTRGVFTHAAMAGCRGMIYEASIPLVTNSPFDEWLRNFAYAVVLRPHPIAASPERRIAVESFLNHALGSDYDLWRAAEAMLIGRVDPHHPWARRILAYGLRLEQKRTRNNYNCSTLVWAALAAGGMTDYEDEFGRHATPADYVDRLFLEPVGYVTEQLSFIPHHLDINASGYVL